MTSKERVFAECIGGRNLGDPETFNIIMLAVPKDFTIAVGSHYEVRRGEPPDETEEPK